MVLHVFHTFLIPPAYFLPDLLILRKKFDALIKFLVKQLENAMTPAEKQRLYKAIDYKENATPQEYPETYVDTACKFILHLLDIEIQNDVLPTPLVLTVALNEVKCQVSMRAGASAMKYLHLSKMLHEN